MVGALGNLVQDGRAELIHQHRLASMALTSAR